MKDDSKYKLEAFYNDMRSYSDDATFKFAYQSKNHWMLMCLIAINTTEGISFENACRELSEKFFSRGTIQSILDSGIASQFLSKSASEKDKRVQLYRLTENAEKQMGAWVERQTEIFTK